MTGNPPNTLDLNALYSAHQGELVRHLAKMVNCEETAADLVQESYLILSKTAHKEAIPHPRGFLYRVAINLALNHLRRSKVAETYSHYLVADDNQAPSTEHLVQHRQRLERFIQVVDGLPPRGRDVFILHKVYGMTHKEIAEELGITVSGVEKHIAKGLSQCRQKFLAMDKE
jgi:RNA polymerase sigma-70 factor (ECF subfamily)